MDASKGVADVDTVVIGAGAMGSATTWHLARRGRSVLLLERFAPQHTNGASHGASRNFNVAYDNPTYLEMLVEALPLWRELEAASETAILDQVGIVNHGPDNRYPGMLDTLESFGIPGEILTPAVAAARWPGIRFDSAVLHTPSAGRLNADLAVAALQADARANGAEVRHNARVDSIDILGDSAVVVRVGDDVIRARSVVITAGAWTTDLVAGATPAADIRNLLPRLTVTQEQPAHFARTDDSFDWPGFNHTPGTSPEYDYWYSPIYGMFTPGQGVKAGWHGAGPVVHPDGRDFTAEPVQLAALQRYVREWLPGADADALVPVSCTYTTTPDSNFVLDRVGPVVIGAGFSGHGFKFTPVVGRILADLVDRSRPAPALFTLNR